MSATGRGLERVGRDFYPTDPRLVIALLRASDEGEIPTIRRDGIWVEPAYGDGSIVRTVDGYWPCADREWMTIDIRPETGADTIGDFTDPNVGIGGDVYLTNPPYRNGLAIRFAQNALVKRAPGGIVLLLVNNHHFGPRSIGIEKGHRSGNRIAWHKANRCDRVALSPRPSFGVNKHGKPGTDQCTYEWCVWGWPNVAGLKNSGRWFGPLDWKGTVDETDDE